MPFTFSHPAVVIHLSKTRLRLSLTGLVAGSMVPDFEFFLRLKLDDNIGHHWPGFFLFDVPVALLMCFVFHNIIRNTLIQHLPGWFQHRFSAAMDFNWNRYTADHKVNLLVSVVIGVLSHFIWDAFTHHDGAFVLTMPFLSETLAVGTYSFPVYSILQLLSSAWGLWVLYRFIKTMPVQQKANAFKSYHYTYWAAIAAVSIGILIARLLLMQGFQTFWNIFFAAIGSMVYALILISLVFKRLSIIRWQE